MHSWIYYKKWSTRWMWNPFLLWKVWKIYQFNWPWKTKSSFWPHLLIVIFCFILFHTIKEKVCYKSLSNIYVYFGVSFFQHGEKACFYFCKYSFENFLQTWHTQIRKSSKSFETFLEWFYLSIFLRWLIVIYTLQLMSSSLLRFKPSNCIVNLNQTLYLFTRNRLNKGFSDTCR